TKFTEVGYVGRDVDQIIRDLLDVGLQMSREKMRREVTAAAKVKAEDKILDALVGTDAKHETREKMRAMLERGELEDRQIEIEVEEGSASLSMPSFDIPGMPGASVGMINLQDMLGKAMGRDSRSKPKTMPISAARETLIKQESDNLLDPQALTEAAIFAVEQNGIVFIDEIDKICARSERSGADVSREGVQRDLLPLIEGTTVSTKHGTVKTDHILFIASGAFHLAKPSDLLPELQGRLPIRVELKPLTGNDLRRILTEPEASLIKQYIALMATDGIDLDFAEEAIDELARIAAEINGTIENIGARRLHTVMERLLDEISFTAPDRKGEAITIDKTYVHDKVAELAKNTDLSKFIL
ncbi:MAG: ATP-dependent protease ATPase subunit HslU, partial [Alphaproteobacteria bacterium]|nr:ATP-dependent protease ATPase subunit HslU [Alphaproteobacteria bacterium]